jgi:hypothetical protein
MPLDPDMLPQLREAGAFEILAKTLQRQRGAKPTLPPCVSRVIADGLLTETIAHRLHSANAPGAFCNRDRHLQVDQTLPAAGTATAHPWHRPSGCYHRDVRRY